MAIFPLKNTEYYGRTIFLVLGIKIFDIISTLNSKSYKDLLLKHFYFLTGEIK